ncbi:MAG: DNA repair protein RecN [Treponema sp.]|jgi:DNA repair protein RecN (Recombination protein N)|nr:DNA repair protein RecN [Treponema sp.]
MKAAEAGTEFPMLEELSIRNYALIDNISLSFQKGFNVLTGETGAGKSIIVGSLGFLLGARADAEVIRTGAEEAHVSAVLSLDPRNREGLNWLQSRDIAVEDNQIIVRRSLKSSGRGSAYIQNVPVGRGELEEFMALLFDLHGQHNHESLLRKESHRRYLDRFAGLEDETAAFNRVFLELADKKKALEISLSSERDRENRLELLSYAVEEIDKAAPKPGESRELEGEAQRLGDFEKLAAQVNTAAGALFDDEISALSLARRVKSAVDNAAGIDGTLGEIQKRLEDLYYEAEDISEEFRSYRDRLVYDPRRLEEVEERLALLYRLRKKYAAVPAAGTGSAAGSGEEAVLAYRAQAAAEIEALSGAGENREKLKVEIAVREKDIAVRAGAIGQKRRAAAEQLGARITGILTRLGMPNARFQAAVLPKGQGGGLVCGPWGAEDVEFLISANTGEPLKDLSRIASGGELSRIMLAIKTILAEGGQPGAASQDSLETLIFDEIDTGIGGEVALSVGEYLTKIGGVKQVLCVTHLASIAVRADNHLRVEKRIEGGRTFTGVAALDRAEKRQEIARMLAGDSGKAALAHADDLLLKYGKRSG